MYCRKCGNELRDKDIFCNICGTKVEVIGIDKVKENNANIKNSLYYIIAFIVVCILIYGIAIWSVRQDDKKADKTWVASALNNYSVGTVTEDDFDITKEKSKSSKTRIIYRVTMKDSSKLLIDGTVYVGLIKRNSDS